MLSKKRNKLAVSYDKADEQEIKTLAAAQKKIKPTQDLAWNTFYKSTVFFCLFCLLYFFSDKLDFSCKVDFHRETKFAFFCLNSTNLIICSLNINNAFYHCWKTLVFFKYTHFTIFQNSDPNLSLSLIIS